MSTDNIYLKIKKLDILWKPESLENPFYHALILTAIKNSAYAYTLERFFSENDMSLKRIKLKQN